MPESSLTAIAPYSFTLVVKNTGTADANITSIKIEGAVMTNMSVTTPYLILTGAQETITGTPPIIPAAAMDYEVLISTAAGNVYRGTLTTPEAWG